MEIDSWTAEILWQISSQFGEKGSVKFKFSPFPIFKAKCICLVNYVLVE